MPPLSPDPRASAPLNHALTDQCRALVARTAKAMFDWHGECVKQKYLRGWAPGESFPTPQPKLFKGIFEAADLAQPRAGEMSTADIDAALAANADPWADPTTDGAAFPRVAPLPFSELLCAIRLTQILDAPVSGSPQFPPGVTLIRIPDEGLRETVSTAMECALPFFLTAAASSEGSPRQPVSICAQPAAKSYGSSQANRVPALVDAALSHSKAVLVIARDAAALSESGRMLLAREVDWPPMDGDTIIELLRVTHSHTGRLAEAELRARLPSDAVLANLPLTTIIHAFQAETTLHVADHLARLHFKVESPERCTLADIHGLPTVTDDLEHLVEDIALWRDKLIDWDEVSSSILFYGPPGTGKTMLADAIAGSTNATFVSTSYADCQRFGHMGDYLNAMAAQVDRAISKAPSVFFIDELDSYQSRNDRKSSRYMHSVVNGMLEQLTRLSNAPGVIIIAATNHLEQIDPALMRSGRFDRKIAIGLPDTQGVADILRAHLKTPDMDVQDLPSKLIGMSGADIAAVARTANGIARHAKVPLAISHVRSAVQHHAPHPSPEHLKRKAIHEAGHAVVAHALGLPPGHRLFLSAHGGGYDAPRERTLTRDTADRQLAMLLGGRAAEIVILGGASSGAGGDQFSDLSIATELALEVEYCCGLGPTLFHGAADRLDRLSLPDDVRDRIEAVLQKAQKRASSTIAKNRKLLMHVANALLKHNELDAAALKAVLRSSPGKLSASDGAAHV